MQEGQGLAGEIFPILGEPATTIEPRKQRSTSQRSGNSTKPLA